jgi:hypothetical protein
MAVSSPISVLAHLAGSRGGTVEERRRALWVIGHHGEASLAPLLRQVADRPDEPLNVREVAAYAWYRLVPKDFLGEAVPPPDTWPPTLLIPVLWDRVEQELADAHRRWVRRVAAERLDLSPAATLALGDHAAEVVSWAFMSDAELAALGLPPTKQVDWGQALLDGSSWASDPPRDFFGRQAVRDAYRWAEHALKSRLALLRYHTTRQWEAWVRDTMGEASEAGIAAPNLVPIALRQPAPAAEATALLILGAFWAHAGPDRGAEVSSRLSSAAAAAHLSTVETYQNAQVCAWHVAALTGRLAIQLTTARPSAP